MSLPIDLDSEMIQYEGSWFTRDDLARHIKELLDHGNFNVGKPSHALELLSSTLQSLQTLSVRLTPDIVEAINGFAGRIGRTPAGILRDAVVSYLHLDTSIALGAPPSGGDVEKARSSKEPASRRPTNPEIPVLTAPATASAQVNVGHTPTLTAPAPLGSGMEPKFVAALPRGASSESSMPTPVGLPSIVVDSSLTDGRELMREAQKDAAKEGKKLSKDADGVERSWFGG